MKQQQLRSVVGRLNVLDEAAFREQSVLNLEILNAIETAATLPQRGQLDASIVFMWDFADLTFHPDSVDLSREVRQVIGLRDDVLDEIAQLYIERKSVLMGLPFPPEADVMSTGKGVQGAAGGGDSVPARCQQAGCVPWPCCA